MRRPTRTALLTLSSAALLAASAGAGEVIRFEVEPGVRLIKNVLVRHELNLDEMGKLREGGPLMREDIGGWLTSGHRVNVFDEYVAVDGGRGQLFRRKFRDVGGHGKVNLSGGRGRIEERTTRVSPLKGQTVLYTWIEDEGEYGRTYDELYGDEELLAGLLGDMDCLALLPSGEVEIGASWEIDPSSLRTVLGPGGDLAVVPQEDTFFARMIEVGLGGDLAEVLGRRITGTALATFTGVREVGGRRYAEIALELSIASRRDRTATYLAGMPKKEKREASSLQSVTIDWTLVGDGELLWDLDAGRAESLRIQGHESFGATIGKVSSEETGEPMLVGQLQYLYGMLNRAVSRSTSAVSSISSTTCARVDSRPATATGTATGTARSARKSAGRSGKRSASPDCS